MNARSARKILSLYLEDPKGEKPPLVQKAVKVLQSSPEMVAEYERQLALDKRACRILGSVEPPPEVLESFATEVASTPTRRFNPRDPAMIAVIIGFVLLVGVLTWDFLGRPAVFPADAQEIAEAVVAMEEENFEQVGEPVGKLEDWFVLKGFDGFGVPEEFSKHLASAAAIYRFDNQPVAVVSVPRLKSQFIVFSAAPYRINIPRGEWRTISLDGNNYAAAIRELDGMCFMIIRKGSLAGLDDLVSPTVR
jgi:hypothetical protein